MVVIKIWKVHGSYEKIHLKLCQLKEKHKEMSCEFHYTIKQVDLRESPSN